MIIILVLLLIIVLWFWFVKDNGFVDWEGRYYPEDSYYEKLKSKLKNLKR
jgi:hypothetical protein